MNDFFVGDSFDQDLNQITCHKISLKINHINKASDYSINKYCTYFIAVYTVCTAYY